MASIAKLSIRGVRSFSPNDDEQVIGFCFPLTIIVGANGCGKTTIIESLKYAVTGSLPPGIKSGQSFVHDPRSIGQASVKASIKLRFTNTEGSSMVVARSMEVSQKKTTASFKALDGTIRTVNRETGERVTLSHKCTELDNSIPTYLGVSKPILEHVMFCHQEDSSWPLQEGAVLKKRFDDIFDSTRYAKALEAIKAEKKNYASIAKDLKAELEGLKSHKFAATGFREELEICMDKISGLEDEVKKCNEELEKERRVDREAFEVLGKIQDFENELQYKESDFTTKEAVFNKQKQLLGKDDMTDKYSRQELEDRLRQMNDERHGNEATRSLDTKEREYQEIERNLEKLRKESNDLNSRKGKLEAERDAHTSVLRARFLIMEEIHKRHNIEMDPITQDDDDNFTQGTVSTAVSRSTIFTNATQNTYAITQEDIDAFQRAIEHKNSDLCYELGNLKKKHRVDEDKMQKDILELQGKMSAIDSERSRNESAKNQAIRELTGISSQMSGGLPRVRKEHVEEAIRQADDLAKSRDIANNNPRRTDIVKDIRVLEDKLKSISATIEQDTKIRNSLRLRFNEESEIKMLENQVNQEYEALADLVKDNSYLIGEHGENSKAPPKEDVLAPTEVLANNVRNKLIVAQNDLERQTSRVNDIQKKLSEKNALLNSHRQRFGVLHQKRTNLLGADGGVQKIKSVIRAMMRIEKDNIDIDKINEDSNPTEVAKFIADQITNFQEFDEKPEHLNKIMKRLKRMAKADAICPCCARPFADESEINNFNIRMNELSDPDVSELHQQAKKKVASISENLGKYENWRKTINENIQDHLECIRVSEELKDVEAIIQDEEGNGRGSLKELESEMKSEEATLEQKKKAVTDLQTLMSVVSSIQVAAKRVWDKMGDVKAKKSKLDYSYMGNLDDPRDLKTVESDLAKSSDLKEAAYTDINKLNNEQTALNENISRITNQAASAEKNAREKEEAFKRDQESAKRKDELNDELKRLAEEDKELDKQSLPLRTQLLQKESDIKRMRDDNARVDESLSNQLKDFERDVDKLKDVSEKIDQYQRSNKEMEIANVDKKLRLNAGDIISGEEKLVEMKPQLESLRRAAEDGERQKKTIRDNIELLKLDRQMVKLEEEINICKDQLGTMGGDDAKAKKRQAQVNIQTLQNKIERYNGRMSGLKEQKTSLKKKLGEPEYKDVDEKHRMKMIEHETTNIVVTDLDKYYDALDKALLSYHGMKISDINKIIRELWTLTYKGEDISNIEIQSGQDSASRANRSYNYRIVMYKGATQMDMRGRCSAGQRVLASIVIRLALAETFCLNCGVLALDEPTTNLDYENKRGLAIAMAQIIAARASQANFQLVVITHDEDFVTMMKQELSAQTGFSMPERYYQVSREESNDGRFYSKISAIDWDDL